MSAAFDLGPEPTWHRCERDGCANESMQPGLCWDCQRAADAATKAQEVVDATLATILDDYRLPFDAHVLRQRNVPATAIAEAQRALSQRFVVVVGPDTGRGKSCLAGAMLGAWAAISKKPGLWLPSWSLCGEGMRIRDEWISATLVVVDDLGNERDMRSSLVPELLERRKSDKRAMWITTALTQARCAEKYGANNARRVFERAVHIDCGGR